MASRGTRSPEVPGWPLRTVPLRPVIESTSIIELWEERGPRVLLPEGKERIARHYDRLGDHYLIAPVASLVDRGVVPHSEEWDREVAALQERLARAVASGAFEEAGRLLEPYSAQAEQALRELPPGDGGERNAEAGMERVFAQHPCRAEESEWRG